MREAFEAVRSSGSKSSVASKSLNLPTCMEKTEVIQFEMQRGVISVQRVLTGAQLGETRFDVRGDQRTRNRPAIVRRVPEYKK